MNVPPVNKPPLGPSNYGVEIVVIEEHEGETDTTVRPLSESLRKQLEALRKGKRSRRAKGSRRPTKDAAPDENPPHGQKPA
jgi:hypothetical protein